MARYVGSAVATALAASIYGSVIADRTAAGDSQAESLASGLATASWAMVLFSLVGVAMAVIRACSARYPLVPSITRPDACTTPNTSEENVRASAGEYHA